MAGACAQLAAGGLLERGAEQACIRQAIAASGRGHGSLLIVEGAAGIGKSALLRALCAHATDQGVQTLTVRASELERDFGFGVVRKPGISSRDKLAPAMAVHFT